MIDHAWGWEPCTIEQIKAYKPQSNSISVGQVLKCPYEAAKGKLIVREMTDLLVLDLVEKGLVTDQIVLTIGYDSENLSDPSVASKYKGEVSIDRYGKAIPKHAHGSANLGKYTSSTKKIIEATMNLYDRIVNQDLKIRRAYVVCNRVIREQDAKEKESYEQLDLFTDYTKIQEQKAKEEEMLQKEKKLQQAVLEIKKKYGKNAMLKGMNLEEGATAIERNAQIGGHKA